MTVTFCKVIALFSHYFGNVTLHIFFPQAPVVRLSVDNLDFGLVQLVAVRHSSLKRSMSLTARSASNCNN